MYRRVFFVSATWRDCCVGSVTLSTLAEPKTPGIVLRQSVCESIMTCVQAVDSLILASAISVHDDITTLLVSFPCLGQLYSRLDVPRVIRVMHMLSRGTTTQFVRQTHQLCVSDRVRQPLQGWSVWRRPLTLQVLLVMRRCTLALVRTSHACPSSWWSFTSRPAMSHSRNSFWIDLVQQCREWKDSGQTHSSAAHAWPTFGTTWTLTASVTEWELVVCTSDTFASFMAT